LPSIESMSAWRKNTANTPTPITMGTATTINTTNRRSMWRLLTSVALIGLCGFTAVRGWSITEFAETRGRVASEGQVNHVNHWINVPGLADAALETSLAQLASASDIDGTRKRAEALATVLSLRPLSSENWLSLAGTWLVTDRPYGQVLVAIQMSSVTGPNEGAIMWQRGVFGLLQWDSLPPDARMQTIRDLAGSILGLSVDDVEIGVTKAVLSTKSAETRSQITDLLKVEGTSEIQLTRMGL
jgi:hypothetical protein